MHVLRLRVLGTISSYLSADLPLFLASQRRHDFHRNGLRSFRKYILARWPHLPGMDSPRRVTAHTHVRIPLYRWNTLTRQSRTLGVHSSPLLRGPCADTHCHRTAIGLRVKDGVVLAVEKIIHSKLLVPEANRRIQTIDKHIGLVRYFTSFVAYRWLNFMCRPLPDFSQMAGT